LGLVWHRDYVKSLVPTCDLPSVLLVMQAIAITVTTTYVGDQPETAAAIMQQIQQQTGRRHVQAGSRQHVHRRPDPAAAVKWQLQSEQGVSPDVELLKGFGAETEKNVQLQPRITADPSLQAQQLAGWVHLGADGAPEAASQAGAQDAAGMDVDQPGVEEQPGDEDEFLGDEDWV
jgi:hypothetical protein